MSPASIDYAPNKNILAISGLKTNTIKIVDFETRELIKEIGQQSSSTEETVPPHVDGYFSNCQFAKPRGICFSQDEKYIFVADTDHNAVRIIDLESDLCSTIVGLKKRKGLRVGKFEDTILDEPKGLALDLRGNILVTTKSAVILLDLIKSQSTLVAGGNTFGHADGSEAQFDHPDGIVQLENGDIVVADTFNHRVRVIDKDGVVSNLAGNGDPGH